MAITHRTFVILIFPLCCASVALLITSLATHNWFEATSVFKDDPQGRENFINYGLFAGTHEKYLFETPRTYNLYMTCLSDLGICALSCMSTVEDRELQVRQLYEDANSSLTCEPVRSLQYYQYDLIAREDNYFPASQEFIELGLWASTIACMAVAILMASLGAVFSVVNTAGNPVEPILGILGLYIWNAAAVAAIGVTMSIWGAQYAITLRNNAVLPETISGETSSAGQGYLGYSYWLMIPCAALHLLAILSLIYRRHLIRTTPPAPTINMEEDPDGIIFLY